MKINNTQNQSKHFFKPKLMSCSTFSKTRNFYNKTGVDSFEKINFTSNLNNRHNATIENIVSDKNLKDDIVNNIILDSKGNYRSDIEKLYIELYKLALLSFDENSLSRENYIQIQKLTALILKTLKNGDNFNLDYKIEDFQMLFAILENAESMNFSDEKMSEFLYFSKKNGNIDIKKAEAMIEVLANNNRMTPLEAHKFIERYCEDKKGNINDEHAPASLAALFASLGTPCFLNFDKYYSYIKTADDKIDWEKYALCSYVLLNTHDEAIIMDTIANSNYLNSADDIRMKIIKALEYNNTNKNGNVDIKNAAQMFNDWYIYAMDERINLNNSLKINSFNRKTNQYSPISLSDVIGIAPETSLYFDSNLYRVYILLTQPSYSLPS